MLLPKSTSRKAPKVSDQTEPEMCTDCNVWYRSWSSVGLQHDDTQAWVSSLWPGVATGGKKGQEIYHALVPLIHAAARHEYLISLDFSLAFDYCDPRPAIYVLRKLHMLDFMCDMLLAQWTDQRSFLSKWNTYLNLNLPPAVYHRGIHGHCWLWWPFLALQCLKSNDATRRWRNATLWRTVGCTHGPGSFACWQ